MAATFAFVDLAGFSALAESHGDHAALDLVARFSGLVDDALGKEARLVSTIGDAAFVVSDNPGNALDVLVRLFRQADCEADFPLLRAGAHHGEAVLRGNDYVGTAVNIAARVTALAGGGQAVVTSTIAEVARTKDLAVSPLGCVPLKNIRQKLELFSIDLSPATASSAIDPVCRMRVRRAGAAGHFVVEGRDYWFCSLDCAGVFIADVAHFTAGKNDEP
jgi:adenylate cyclase